MTKEQELELIFANEIIRPWEELNKELSKHYAVSPIHTAFTNKAYALAHSLKHLSEASGGLKSKDLNSLSSSYYLISDLSDTKKHGKRDNPTRTCTISTASLYERKFDKVVLLRFLRNVINMNHVTLGKKDFMECAKDCALFLASQLKIIINWTPVVFNNTGEFSNTVKTHASKDNQVVFTGTNFKTVELSASGEYTHVELNGTIEYNLTSEF